jgi:hypothetical protein
VCLFYWMAAHLGIVTTVSLCLFSFAALALYCALLCTLLLIAEQICIALEHARGFVAGDLHAFVQRTASFPYLMRSTPPKVVEDSSDVLRTLDPRPSTVRTCLIYIKLGCMAALSVANGRSIVAATAPCSGLTPVRR